MLVVIWSFLTKCLSNIICGFYKLTLHCIVPSEMSSVLFYSARLVTVKTHAIGSLCVNICLINRYKRIGYNQHVMRQTACLVINPTSVDGYASLFNCTTAGQASDSVTAST